MNPGTKIYYAETGEDGVVTPRVAEVCFWAVESSMFMTENNSLNMLETVVYVVDLEEERIKKIDPETIYLNESKLLSQYRR